MKIKLPRSDSHPQVRITIIHDGIETHHTADTSHPHIEVTADEHSIILAEFCNGWGKPDEYYKVMVLQDPGDVVPIAPVEPAPEPAAEPAAEPAPEPAAVEPPAVATEPPAEDKPRGKKRFQ